MKKVWIASIFATLMLMVPFTNVVGASDTVEDCNCNPVNDLHRARVERLLTRLESRIDFILSRYGHIPGIAEKCEDILDVIDSNIQWDFPFICSFLDKILSSIESFNLYILSIIEKYPERVILILFLVFIAYFEPLFTLPFFALYYGVFKCEPLAPPPINAILKTTDVNTNLGGK